MMYLNISSAYPWTALLLLHAKSSRSMCVADVELCKELVGGRTHFLFPPY
jgi:hypothetical protein